MRHALEEEGFRPAAAVVGEATGGDVTIGHRGRMELQIRLRGRSGHASVPEGAVSALRNLPAALFAVDHVASQLPSDPHLGPATAVATAVRTEPTSRNVVPDLAVISVDCRTLPHQTPDGVAGKILEVTLDRAGPLGDDEGVEVALAEAPLEAYTGEGTRWRFHTPGFLMDTEAPLVKAAAEAVGRRNGAGPARTRPWGFASDGGWISGAHGIPCVGFAPGDERLAHTNRERMDLDEFRWCWNRYPEMLRALQGSLTEGG